MSTKSNPKATEKKLERDLATFERLPEKKKELMRLKKQNEEATGREKVEITRKIQEKARKPNT